MDPTHRGGSPAAGPVGCLCSPEEEACEQASADGQRCLVCRTNEPCSENVVGFGFNFFKLFNVDVKTSSLIFSGWLWPEFLFAAEIACCFVQC